MIAIDKPFNELAGISECPGCGKTLVYFESDMKMDIADDVTGYFTVETIYTKCPICGETITLGRNIAFKEDK